MGARIEMFAASREEKSTTPAARAAEKIAASVAGDSFVFSRVQRRGWFAGKDGC